MMKERWAMAKWLTKYIDKNTDRWKKEKQEREESEKKWIEDWAKMTRFEKIRKIKEREKEKSSVQKQVPILTYTLVKFTL